jgi:hypothetical protein
VFALLTVASVLGAVAHGFDWTERVRQVLWLPLYLSLGLAAALFLVGAVGDWRGESAGRRVLPVALAAGVGFFGASQSFGGRFSLFIGYEVAIMLAALAIYGFLAATGRLAGAGRISAGIVLTIVAAIVQLSPLQIRIAVPFDHNGLFHLVQMAATVMIASGVRMGLDRGKASATGPGGGRR